MKKNISNMMNFVSAIRVKVLCLAALSLFVGVNNVAWGQEGPMEPKDKQNYTSNGNGEDWATASNWTGDGYFPGQSMFDNGTSGKYGRGLVTINKKITMGDISDYIYSNRTKKNAWTSLIFDFQSLTLNSGADLTLNSDVYVSGGNGVNACYTYNGGKLTISPGKRLWVEKEFKLSADQTINGGGTLRIGRKIIGGNHTLTANVDIDINTNDEGASNDPIDKLKLIANKNVTINRNKDLEFIDLKINSGGCFKTNYNKTITVTNDLELNGGTLDIAAGTVKATGGDKVLTVKGNAVLKGTGTLNVTKINIADDATLTIDGTRTFDGIEFTGGGKLIIANGKTLTLKNTKFNKNITVLKAEAEEGMSAGNLVIDGYLEGNVGNYPGGSTLTTEVNTELKSGGDFTNIDTIDIKGGTFTNNRISGIEKIKVAEGAKLSTLALEVTTEVELLGTLDNGDITLTGDKITFGSGTGFESGTTVTINSGSGAATINGLGNCFTGHITLNDDQAITYNNSTCILSANYSSLTFNGTAAALCGDAVVDGGFTLSQNVTISGSADDDLTLNGAITGDKDITINGAAVNVVAGAGAVGVGKFTVEEGGKLIYNRDADLTGLSVDHESSVEFGESIELTDPTLGGSVTLADGVSLTLTNNITFGANTDIDYGAGSSVNISNNAVIDSLRSCDLGIVFVAAKPTITYKENSTSILGGTYTALTVKSTAATLCGHVTVENGFVLTNNISITSSSKNLTLEGAVSGNKIVTATGTIITVSDDDDDFAGGFVIGSGSLTINRECSLDTLAVNGGLATLAAATTVEGITVSDGTVSINAGTEVSHSFAVSGGAVTLGAVTSVAGDFSFESGTFAVNAATTIEGNGTLNGTTTFGNTGTITIAGDATLDGTINLTGTEALLTVGGVDKTVTFGSNTSISDGSKLIIGNGSTIDGIKGCITGVDLDGKDIIYESGAEVILPANYATLQTNSNVTLCGGNVSVAGTLTWNSGNITLNNYDLTLKGALGGNTTYNENHTIMVGHNGVARGHLIRSGFDGTVFVLPIGTTQGNTLQFAPVTISAESFTKENDENPASISITSANAMDEDLGSALNLKRSWDIVTDNISSITNAEIIFQYDVTDYGTKDFDGVAWEGVVVDADKVDFSDSDPLITVSELSDIEGHWTAIDNGVVLYSTNDGGNWYEGTTWTTNDDGSDDGEDVYPNGSNNVIIRAGTTVTITGDNAESKTLGVNGTLYKGDKSLNGVRRVYGNGVLQVKGTFGADDTNYDEFLAETGGTVELMDNFSGQSFFNFNNLILNNSEGLVSYLDPSGANILGDLIIRGGAMEFNGTGAIAVGDSIRVESGQTLTFSSTPEVTVSAIDAKVGNVAINGNVTITDSVDLAGTHFTVNEGKSLILSNGTKHTTDATVGGDGTVELANGKDLKGTLNVANLKLNSTATISGTVFVNNNLNTPSAITITGDGSLSVKKEFSNSFITTYTDITIESSTSSIGNAKFVINNGAKITNNRGGSNIKGLTINNGGKFFAMASISFDTLTMRGDTAKLEAHANVSLKKLTSGHKHYLSGIVKTVGDCQINFLGNIDFAGIEQLEGTFRNINTSNNISISNLKKCLGDGYTFSADNNITYDETSDYMLSGNYQKLIIDNTNIHLCNSVIVNTDFSPSVNTTLTGVGESVFFAVKRNVTEGKSISFSNINVELGKSNVGGTSISATGLNIAAGNTLTINGEVKVISNDLTFGGTGAIVINDTLLSATKIVTFSDGQIIDGAGRLLISGGKIDGGKLITKANVEITGGTNSVAEYEVRGGTFTNNGGSDIAKLTVFKNATLKAATNTTVGTLAVADGGTIVIADNKTLTASTDNLTVSGAATITSEGSSNISAANVELAASSKLIINKTITLNHPLQITHASDTIIGGADAVLAWSGASENQKVSVITERTLTLGGTLVINSDVTIDGAIKIGDGKDATFDKLELGGSQVTFTAKTDFTGTDGKLSFTNSTTIKGLTVNPNISTACLEFDDSQTITYDANCTTMLPGVYGGLTLNTGASRNISLFDNVTVNGTFSWAAGRIALNGKELTVAQFNFGKGAAAFGPNHLVIMNGDGKLTYKELRESPTVIAAMEMPVGTYTTSSMGDAIYHYTPATLSNITLAQDGWITMQVEPTSQRGKTADLARYWTITSSDEDITGKLILVYNDDDDVVGYGANENHYWSVMHDNLKFGNEGEYLSPYSGDSIKITTTTALCGVWTAWDYPDAITLYSYGNGTWKNPANWTTISTGMSRPADLGNVFPNAKTDVVILNGDVISTDTATSIAARSVTLYNNEAKLEINSACPSNKVMINDISGVGTLRIEGRGDYPSGIKRSTLFMAADGGTVEFYGDPAEDEFTLAQPTFNNLRIAFDEGTNVTMKLPNTPSNNQHTLQVNGELELERGTLRYTQNGQTISVAKDIIIGDEGSIIGEIAGGDISHYVKLVAGGDLINGGALSLTKRTYDTYSPGRSRENEGGDGRGILHFIGETDARFECRGATNISQLIIDKGTNWTHKVTLFSDSYSHFGLTGKATEQATDEEGHGYGNAVPDNPYQINKPLWLKGGTLELTGNVHIKALSEGGDDNFFIPVNGCLHVNDGPVKVDVCFDGTSNKCIMPAGKLLIDAGTVDGKTGSGIAFRNTSVIEVNGGKLRGSQIRPSSYVTDGNTTFIIKGGVVEFDGQNESTSAFSTFCLPDNRYTFIMEGGILKVSSAQSLGGIFVVNCDPANSHISGGEIILNVKKARHGSNNGGTYGMMSTIPLHDLTILNEDTDNESGYVGHVYKKFVKSPYTVDADKLIVTNNLRIGAGVNFNLVADSRSRSIEVGGNLTIESGATLNVGTGDIMFNGGAKEDPQLFASAGTITSTSGTGYYDLTIDDDSRMLAKNNFTVNHLFRLSEGAELNDDPTGLVYTMNGNVWIDGTHEANTVSPATMVLNGRYVYSTGHGALNNVKIGVNPEGQELKLEDPNNENRSTKLTITGALDFSTNRIFNIGSSNLELGLNATVVATDGSLGSARMIRTIGKSSLGVTKVYGPAPRNSFTFPIGFDLGGVKYYTPATISYSSAGTYGSITTRSVSGHEFRDTPSLNCYWITSEHGFENKGNLEQAYHWWGNELSGNSAPLGWKGGRKPGTTSEWQVFNAIEVGTDADENERVINISNPAVTSADGYYSCGQDGTFVNNTIFFTSEKAEEGVVNWNDPDAWSTEGVCGISCGQIPGANASVQIGDESHPHTVLMNVNVECASLNIAPGSTLDLGSSNNLSVPIVDVDEAVGAGTLRIGRAYFPDGDFGKFNGEYGGTVEYYGANYSIPNGNATFCNLVISGGTSANPIYMPSASLTVFNDFTVKGGYVRSRNGNYTVTVNGDMSITGNGDAENPQDGVFTIWKSGAEAQTYIVKGDLTVASGSTMQAGGSSAATNNKLQIYGNLTVNGIFKALADTKFKTEFVGATNSIIGGSATDGNYQFGELECNKANVSTKLTITNPNAKPGSATKFLDLTSGTFEVAIGNGNNLQLTGDADLVIGSTACLSVVSGDVNVANTDNRKHLKLSGQINMSGGSLTVGTGSNCNSILYAVSGSPAITISGGTLKVNGQISRDVDQTKGALVWHQTGGDVIVYGKLRAAAEPAWIKKTAAFEILNGADGSEFVMSGGTITVKTGNGGDTYGDIYLSPGVKSCTGGKIIVCDSLKLHTEMNLAAVEISNGGRLAVFDHITLDSLIINSTGRYYALGHNLTVRKALLNHNSESTELLGGVSKGFVIGSASQLTKFIGTNMVLEGYTDRATQFGELEFDGDITLTSNVSNIRVAGDLTQTSGTVVGNNNVISLYGDIIYNGIFTGIGGIDLVSQTAPQTIRGDGLGKIETLKVSGNYEALLNTNLYITGKIVLGASLYINRSLVTLGPDATVVAKQNTTLDVTRMIRLNGESEDKGVTKYVKQNAESDFVIPIGITGHYTPAHYHFGTNTKPNASINVRIVNALHSNLSVTPSKWLNYYWIVKTNGFGESERNDYENYVISESEVEVTQTYTYTQGKVDSTESGRTMLPEYMHIGGNAEYKWIPISSPTATVSESAKTITFNSFGHIAGNYTAGVVETDLYYTGLPVLYSKGVGKDWYGNDTWEYKDEEGEWQPYLSAPAGNPIHIRPGDTVEISGDTPVRVYCLYFDRRKKGSSVDCNDTLGVLDVGTSMGSNFTRVDGVGHLKMSPNGVQYRLPAGDFGEFLNDPRSVIEFSGGSGQLPNSIVGHVSQPLQNVILSGTGTKTLMKEDGEYINGYLSIRNGVSLNFGNTPIHIKGDWIDENTGENTGFVPGNSNSKSIVEFDGTEAQNIIMSNNKSSFWNLKINNPAGVFVAADTTVAVANIRIDNQLYFSSGCVNTTDTSHLIIGTSASVANAGTSSYVKGPLEKIIGTTGTGFTFPIGDANYAPTTLGNVSAVGNYKVAFHSSGYEGDPDKVSPLTIVSDSEHWTVSGPSGSSAVLSLRASSSTMSLTNSVLDRLKVAGLANSGANDGKWEQIASSYTSGVLPQAIVATTNRVALGSYNAYTIGYVSTTARLLDPDDNIAEPREYHICDGNSDAASVPVYFTGKGGPYTLNYRVIVGTDSVERSVIISDDNGTLEFTGDVLGGYFSSTTGGYNTLPYIIKIVGVSEGGLPGIHHDGNKAAINVHYNAVPVISGASYVGMTDTRVYTVGTDGPVNNYAWTVTTNSSKTTLESDDNSVSVLFASNGEVDYPVVLKATKSYETIRESYICSRYATKDIEVRTKPQPAIHRVAGFIGNEFSACKASNSGPYDSDYDTDDDIYNYMTELVSGHIYHWTINPQEAGTIISGVDANICHVVWNKDFNDLSAQLQVVEKKVVIDGEGVEHHISSDPATRTINLFNGISINNADILNPIVCDATYGGIVIKNPNSNLWYQIFDTEGNELSVRQSGIADVEKMTINTDRTMSSSGEASKTLGFVVKVLNNGCSASSEEKTMTIRENPAINQPVIADSDLYIGNIALVSWTKTSINAPVNYSFIYSDDGVSYPNGKPDADGDTISVSGKPFRIDIPKTDKIKGQLVVLDNGYGNKYCSSSYNITETPISQASLWKGYDTKWEEDYNWWSGSKPTSSKDAVIRSGKKVNIMGDVTTIDESGSFALPVVSGDGMAVKDVVIESTGSISVATDKVLTIHGDVDCAGEFTGEGTVAFNNGVHTISGDSPKFVNLTNDGTVSAAHDITVTGNINNAGIFTGSTANVILEGSSMQIDGEGQFENVKVSVGSGNFVTVKEYQTINGTMTLNSGHVKVDDGKRIKFSATGDMDKTGDSWIVGTAEKTWASEDGGPFTFIVGSESRLGKVTVDPDEGGAVFSASYTYTAGIEPITENMPDGMTRASGMELWNVHGEKNGVQHPSKLTLYWADNAGSAITDMADGLVIAHKIDETHWEMISDVNVDFVNRSIAMKNLVSSYSGFTFGTTSVSADVHPLPVTFAAFTGRQTGNSVVLEWATMSEKDNDYFEIERSLDGVNYVTIGYVGGAGDSDRRIDYTFSDNAPEQGWLYYRLSQVDFDGTRAYADKVVSVQYSGNDVEQLTIVPNPTDGRFRVSATGSMAGGVVQLLSQTGNVVRTVNVDSYDAVLDISDLSSGIYLLRYVNDTKILQQKVVKY
ncbi:MAG: T9SS type A sorting domain-containing protein [Salinivirgaceae bacterium]|nr:T9SS type A sorting domain-containing protein [Salinivirgaceae bacterium]